MRTEDAQKSSALHPSSTYYLPTKPIQQQQKTMQSVMKKFLYIHSRQLTENILNVSLRLNLDVEVERVQHKDACCWIFPLPCRP